MDQFGIDLQYANEGWLCNFEGIAGSTSSEEYSAMVEGFKYTVYGIGGSTINAGFLLEGHLDSLGSNAFNPLNRDFFWVATHLKRRRGFGVGRVWRFRFGQLKCFRSSWA